MDWVGFFFLLALGLVLLVVTGVARCLWMLTHPPRRTYAFAVSRSLPGTPAELPPIMVGPVMAGGAGGAGPLEFREWTHRCAGLEFPVWEISGRAPAGPTIIITHGWGESRIHSLQRVQAVLPSAARIILWDLRGHGEATGACALGAPEVDDLRSLLDALATGPSPRFVLFGFSLGAGISIAAGGAARPDPRIAAVIAEAPYRLPITPARAVMQQAGYPHAVILPVALGILAGATKGLSVAAFDRVGFAARLAPPLLVLHAQEDRIAPLEDAQAIVQAAPHATLVSIPGAGHADMWSQPAPRALAIQAIDDFLARTVR